MSSLLPERLAIPVSVAALLCGMAGLLLASRAAIGGEWGFPLDDAYIHAALARTLAETGTWGVRPDAFVSASSSPGYTALLALLFASFGPSLWILLAVNALAAIGVLLVAARLVNGSRLTTLLGLVLLGPLPYLAGLGMEHVLQTLLALGIVLLSEAQTGGRGARALLVLCAVAPLFRYELLFLVAAVAVVLGLEGQRRLALGVIVAGVSLVGAFAVWSTAMGGLPLPNSLLMKAGLVSGFEGQLRRNVTEGAPVIVLAVTAMVLATSAVARRRAVLFAGCVILQVAFAGIGWLYRYEGWLVVWGVVLVVPLLVAAPGARLWRSLLMVCALGPCAWRAWGAWACYAPSSVTIHAGDGALARMVADHFPAIPVAVHDIGVLAWSTSAPILDLAGLATTDVTRLHVRHALNGAALDDLVSRHGVELAWADAGWMSGDLPPSFREVGTVSFPLGDGGRATTRVWVTRPELAEQVRQALVALPSTEPNTRTAVAGAVAVPLDTLTTTGTAVVHEGSEIAFYTGGVARFLAPASGRLTLLARGTLADGRGPTLRIVAGGQEVEAVAGPDARQIQGPAVEAGQTVEVRYTDDALDAAGNDRNLWIGEIRISPGPP